MAWLTIIKSAFFYSKFNPLKNRSIINSYIYSFLFFWKTNVFFLLFFKISKNRPKFQRIFFEIIQYQHPKPLAFPIDVHGINFPKNSNSKTGPNGPVNRDKKTLVCVQILRTDSKKLYRGCSVTLPPPQFHPSKKFFSHIDYPTPRHPSKKVLSNYRGG